MVLDIIDAQEQHKKYPTTFEVPTQKELKNLKVGSIVKICVSEERFWTIVSEIDGDNITATVNNDLIFTRTHGLKLGDTVKFEKKNIFLIFEK